MFKKFEGGNLKHMIATLGYRLRYVGYIIPIVSLGVLLYMWNTTNPATVGPFGILLVFIVLYVFWLSVFFVFLHIGFLLLRKTSLLDSLRRRRQGKVFRTHIAYYVASILAFAPVLILAMQSVNQLTLRDVGLVVLFIGLMIFYILKRV